MKHELIEQLTSFRKKTGLHKRRVFLTTAALLVLLSVTLAMMLPAVTEEQAVFCGKEAHTHEETCTTVETEFIDVLTCEITAHEHQDTCFEIAQNLICVESEHIHNDECYEHLESLICTDPGHEHTETCIAISETLICQAPEHTHGDLCYEVLEQLVCLEECEHIHTDECFVQEEHTESLFTCTLEEHIHTKQCFSNPEADLETEEIWSRTLPNEMTGIWSEDLVSAARSQLGYCESANNYIENSDGTVNGYTRYGAWFGTPYDNWNATFVSFCLQAANVPKDVLGRYGNCLQWIESLQNTHPETYYSAGEYVPAAGDLIFFKFSQAEIEESGTNQTYHMGIVSEVLEADNPSEMVIKTIEGDREDCVSRYSYSGSDDSIIGFAALPKQEPDIPDNAEEPAPSDDVEETIAPDSVAEPDSPEDGANPDSADPTEEVVPLDILEEIEDNFKLYFEGEDFRIEVFYSPEAMLPEDVTLVAEEIPFGTPEYDAYFTQTMEALPEGSQSDFCRFFDVSFISNGEKVEPAAPVEVNIYYAQSLPESAGDYRVIHFAEDGTELIDPSIDAPENGGSTFVFTQNSFSVIGTVALAAEAPASGYWIKTTAIDSTSSNYLIVYEDSNGAYALGVNKSGNSYTATATEISLTALDGIEGVYTCNTISNSLYWKFSATVSGSASVRLQNVNTSRYLNLGSSSIIGNSANCTFSSNASGLWSISGNNRYLAFSNGAFSRSSSNSGNIFTIYKNSDSLPEYTIWLDGSNGNNVMQLKGSPNESEIVTAETNYIFKLPETFTSPDKYAYRLQGWYDVYEGNYYAPGEEITVKKDTVLYADWVASTYNVGQNNDYVVGHLDTNSFITTHVFDYGVLFNVLSANASGSVSDSSHSETWSLVTSGPVTYQGLNTQGITFRDWDTGNKSITYVSGYDSLLSGGLSINNNHGSEITSNIISTSNGLSGRNLINTFFGTGNSFNPIDKTGVIGKTYLGTGNYLYQYMDSSSPSYDNTHNGYYYYDSRLNAASYNQSNQRFYVYNYLERTSDSLKDGGNGANSDFLPFNSPYANTNGKTVNTYSVSGRSGTNYQYDAKYNSTEGGVNCTPSNAGTNYGFGMSSFINFYLPANSGVKDSTGQYINQSITGQNLTFEFSGDDDVWVFLDGELVLDIGGLHGIITGSIDFSKGEVITNGSRKAKSFSAGEHTLAFYYLERGGSQSNCAIYFNIVPRYSLNINKQDQETLAGLAGAEFTIYSDANCTTPANELWTSKLAYDNEESQQSTFVCDQDGIARCWGLVPGRVYYIKETKAPDGEWYTDFGGVVKVSLSASGSAFFEALKTEGSDGFAVNIVEINETAKELQLGITNKADMPTSLRFQVDKQWSDGNEEHVNDFVTIHLKQDDVVIDSVQLCSENNWTHTFEGLPISSESDPEHVYAYTVQEAPVENYVAEYSETIFVNGTYLVTVTNEFLYVLPETGGLGSYLFAVPGVLILLGILIFTNIRRSKYKYQ